MYGVAGRGKPPQLRSLTPRTPPVQPEPTPQGRRHWCRLTEKYCTRIAPPPFRKSLCLLAICPPLSLSSRLFLYLSLSLSLLFLLFSIYPISSSQSSLLFLPSSLFYSLLLSFSDSSLVVSRKKKRVWRKRILELFVAASGSIWNDLETIWKV